MEFDVYSTLQVAQEIGVIKYRVLGWVALGKLLPTKRIGSQYVFDAAAVERARRLRDGEGLQVKPQHLYARIAEDTVGYVSKAEAAESIGVTRETLMRWVQTGHLQAFKRDGRERVLFARVDVERLVGERQGGRAA